MNRGHYFIYLVDKIDGGKTGYTLLLATLFDTEFTWSYKIPTDANRAKDGRFFRDRYANETGDYLLYSDRIEPCNVLEMLVALSVRIEEDIMGEPGDEHPEKWFWEMISNLGLYPATDKVYREDLVEGVIKAWLSRSYEANGNGGLFPLLHPKKDQRLVSIWDQLNFYLNERLKGETL